MKGNMKAAVIGSFIGDSMALGTHWVYNPIDIQNRYGRVDSLLKPAMVDYHLGKDAGEFTHYGDQAYELLVSVSTANEFEAENFMSRWRNLFKSGYKGYFDKATKKTLEQFGECDIYTECVSHSSDLGGASRIAPLLVPYSEDLESLKRSAIEQTKLTHNHPQVMEAAAFFAEVAYEVLHGTSPKAAIEMVIERGADEYKNIAKLVRDGLNSIDHPTRQTISDFGMGGDVNGALQSTVHIIAKYENDFEEAIIENTMAGGDSAARGMLVGMVLGGQVGMNGIPSGWFEGLKRHEELIGFVNQTRHSHYYDYTVHVSY